MESSELCELIPGLPGELGLDCMTRLPYTAHRVASGVCRRWRHLLQSKDFYEHRKQFGHAHKVACLVQALDGSSLPNGQKPGSPPSYGVTVFDSVSRCWERFDPVPKYPNGLPLFCRLASCEGKLVVMGGWDPTTYAPVSDVFVYDFTARRWRQGKEMPSKRSFFAIGALAGRIYVAGGHEESKNALKTAWVYDLREDAWSELPPMSRERDECEGIVIGDAFWVVSGYGTDGQGAFEGNAEVYESGSGRWRRVEGIWEAGKCPRSRVGVGKDGKLASWASLDPAVGVGACGIMLDSRVLVTGSEYQGAPQRFYTMDLGKEGQNGKMDNIDVPDGFSGIVQSGCCVEI